MPYAVPAPAALADAQSAELEEALAAAPDGSARVVDARSPRSVLGAIARPLSGPQPTAVISTPAIRFNMAEAMSEEELP
jgi:hypothetical protein